MKTKSIKRSQIQKSFARGAILAALLSTALVPAANAGVVSTTFTIQQGNLLQDGNPYGSGTSYNGVVDGSIIDSSGTFARTATATSTLGNQNQSGSPNGRQCVGLFSYDLTELNSFIAANTGPYSSVVVSSVSFQLISAGGVSGSAMNLNLYGTDPFTSSGCTWSNYTTATPWTVPYQNLAAPNNTVAYGYTGGGSALTVQLGGSPLPTTTITSGNPLIWNSSTNFITAVTNALARVDKTLYLTARGAFFNTGDNRLNVNYSPTTTVASRPQLTINVQVTTTAAPATWTGGSDTSWITAGNWSPSGVPATDAPIIFDSASTANLNTVLNQDFTIASLSVTNPSGPVSISGANSLTIDTGGIDLSAATQDLTLSAPVVLGFGQTWKVGASRTLSVNGGVSGSAALTVSGAGKVSLGGAATYTGDTTVSAGGTLQMGAANVLPHMAGGGNVNVNGLLDLNGHAEAVNGLTGSGVVDNTAVGAATLTVGNNNTNSNFSGTITNTGGSLALVKTGTGTLTLGGTNTYSGTTTIANGTLVPGNGFAFGTGSVTVNSGATAYPVASMTITNPLVLIGGHLELGGNNDTATWSGPVTVTNGFWMSGDNGNCQQYLSGPMDIGTGGILVTNSGNSGPNGSSTSGLGDILSGPISGSGGIAYYCNGGNSRLTVQGANTYSGDTVVNGTSNGKLNVYGGINPFSTGTVTLNAGAVIEAYPGNVTITNALTLNGGILEGESQYNNYNRLTWAGPITLTANSTLFQYGANNGQMSQGVNVAGPLNLNGYTLTNSGSSGLFSGSLISGPISGTGTILETVNVLYLQGTNTFSGTFRSVGGTLSVQNVYAVQNATLDMNAADAGSVNLNNTNAIIGALTGARDLNLGSGNVSIGNNNSSTTYSGALTNTGSITKVGTGTLTLSGVNTYTGDTTISAGTLALNGSGSVASSPTITVAGGATFDVSAQSPGFVLNGRSLTNSSVQALFNGTNDCSAGTLSLVYDGANPSFVQTNGAMTLSSSTVITVNNTGATLGNGNHTIIAAATAGNVGLVTGTLPAVTVTGNGAAGTATLQINGSGGLDLVVASVTPPQAVINSAVLSGGQLILQGGNGASSGTYSILTSTNVALPLADWTTNTTGTFTAGGAFSNAIPVTTEANRFFLIKQP